MDLTLFVSGSLAQRFDASEGLIDDVVGTVLGLDSLPSEQYERIDAQDVLPRIYPCKVGEVLAHFHRILVEDGLLVGHCPDLDSALDSLAEGALDQRPHGSSLSALETLFGPEDAHDGSLPGPYRGGFTEQSLAEAAQQAGFSDWAMFRGQDGILHFAMAKSEKPARNLAIELGWVA